jgi:tRNA threonylcarbamoyl adenosine modification protein YeaZ/ribosomal-protein-alanine acetyltransferase
MILVLDTCLNACSVALYDEAAARVVVSAFQEMERGHAEALGPMVENLFIEAGIKPGQLSRIAVTYGPGTFTGLRIGLSFAKGMALALDIPLVGLNSLKATAQHMGHEKVIIAHQAGGTGLFYWTSPNGPALGNIEEIATSAKTLNRTVIGSGFPGARTYWPDAKVFADFAASLPATKENVEPLYLRAPDAKPSVSVESSSAHVRLANLDDLNVLVDIHHNCFSTGWSPSDLASLLAIPGAAALVVELAGTIYGFMQFQWVAGEAEINTICVLPNYRRQHFGRDLMDGLLAQLQNMKTSKVFLEVASQNVAAVGLYEAYGFQRTGLRKSYYTDGDDAVTMVKVLAS